jgi:hypothetical protein
VSKLTLPVAFTTYQYDKSQSKRVPVGIVVVAKDSVKAYGLNASAAGSMIPIYADRPADETPEERQQFAENYRDNASESNGYGITTEMVRYSGQDRAKVDADLKQIMDANADGILKTTKGKASE